MPIPRPALVALAAALSLTVSACSGSATPASTTPDPSVRATPCGAVAAAVVDAIQVYVDSFGGIDANAVDATTNIGAAQLQQTAARLRTDAQQKGCETSELVELIRAELLRLRGGTPVQDAVAATFKSDPLGALDPSDPGRREFSVSTAAELADAVARAGTDSVIRLGAGTYKLTAPVVLLRPVTLIGAGADTTTITSDVSGVTLLTAIDGDVHLQDLAITHSGQQASVVVMIAGGGYDLRGVRIAGARGANGNGGFGLVLRPSEQPLDTRPTTQRLTDVTLADNDGGGLVVGGRQAPTIESVTVTGTAGCGLCFVEESAGSVTNATVTDAAVGVRVDEGAAPTLARVSTSGTQVGLALTGSGSVRVSDAALTGGAIGLQATGSGQLDLLRARITDPTELGVRLSGTTATTLNDLVISGEVPVGVAVVAQAEADFTGGSIETSGEAAFVCGEQASGTALGLTAKGQRLGIQLTDTARVDLTDVSLTAKDAAVIASGTSAGAATRLGCADAPVVLLDGAQVGVQDSPTCRLIRG